MNYVNVSVVILQKQLYLAIPAWKHEIPGQTKVIPGSLDTPAKSVKSLDCPGHPWTVGNYVSDFFHVNQGV